MHKFFALLKKDLRLYGKHFLSLFILCALLFLGIAACLGAMLGNAFAEPQKTRLALVDKDGSALSRTAISAIGGSEDVSSLFTILHTDAEDA